MPRSPREHRLERESRRTFEELLGDRFVFRAEVPDYKIDASLEEIDSHDRLTGLRFLAQLKATDEPNLRKALALSMKTEDRAYYRSLSLPVLMVRYHAPTKTTYTRWIHQYDPYYGKPNARTFTFRWDPTDAWDDQRLDDLVADASAFLELRSPNLSLPRPFHVVTSGAWELSAMEIVAALRTGAASVADTIEVRAGRPPAGAAWVEVSEEAITANLAKVTGATMHITTAYDPGVAGEQLAIDAWLMTGAAFAASGHMLTASRLVAAFAARSSVVLTPDGAMKLQGVLSQGHRVRESLEIATELDLSEDQARRQSSIFFVFPAILHSSALSQSEFDEHRSTLEQRIDQRDPQTDPEGRSRELVNLGNLHKARGNYSRAIELYDQAGVADPAYLERAHYWLELGGAHFLARNFEASGNAYRRAVRLGAPPIARALLGDAVLFNGQYNDAFRLLADYTQDHPNEAAEYRLKCVALETICGVLGLRVQERDTEAAVRLAAALQGDPEADEVIACSRAQLERDALWPSAWFNMGLAHIQREESEDALRAFIAGSILMPEVDMPLWRNAMLVGLQLGHMAIVQDILVTVRRFAGPAFLRELVDWARTQDPVFPGEEVIAAIELAFDQLPTHHSPALTLRLIGEHGEVDEFTFAWSGAPIPREQRDG